ncbi:hypothetical protein A2968_02495 [Candidatus Gottesmanbacteria bacterium RIFCSPLOWO2_01_FULL_42_22]|uniref:GIY-YIG domain-containing protein n=1 Tax=Candidatus Gottesmanbacteria bacterium RIFCSPLOWO2_01_FULL_42_22 TaxID=1798391 RepID=A0A1F6B8Z8_9BACT|nr:MAG: hypothetical protein A2968_02495 [Candidatus Gottesmanbacteria bacterium RIFCSPLOWO2_01_FULL_42_22]
MKWFLYIVKCSDGALYTGITTSIRRRILQHNSGLGAKSLKGKLPVTLVYKEVYDNQREAARREREIKGWRKEKKENLLKGLP